MISYFQRTETDADYYERKLRDRLPENLVDMHCHINLPEHLTHVPPERIASDWALQAGHAMTAEEADYYERTLFPEKQVRRVAFPFPIAEADLKENNRYIADCLREKKIQAGLMVTRPEWTNAEVEQTLMRGGFAGLKPYPDLVGEKKGAEISIYDFLPKRHIQLAYEKNKCVLLHLPRARRLAAQENVKELREIVNEFPGIRLIIAHIGRCFNVEYLEEALRLMGPDIHKLWFDTAAVMNPATLSLAFSTFDKSRMMFGLDLPIFLWHGRRYWRDGTYQNACREPLPWKKEVDTPEQQQAYTFFVYEQLDNILTVMESQGFTQTEKEAFFSGNAVRFFAACNRGEV